MTRRSAFFAFLLQKGVPYGHYGRTTAPQAKRNGCVHCRKMWRFELHGAREAPAPRHNAITRARYPVVWVAGGLRGWWASVAGPSAACLHASARTPRSRKANNSPVHSHTRLTELKTASPRPLQLLCSPVVLRHCSSHVQVKVWAAGCCLAGSFCPIHHP